jgi:hypothetical protein
MLTHFPPDDAVLARQIASALKRMQDRVHRAGRYIITMAGQLAHQCQAEDWGVGGMMQDVDLDEAKKKVSQHEKPSVIIQRYCQSIPYYTIDPGTPQSDQGRGAWM